MQSNYEIPGDKLIAEATVSKPFDSQQTLDTLATTPTGPAGLGVITEASPGTQIVRDGANVPVTSKQALVPGDRVIVPKDGFANVVLPGRQPGEVPITGTFTGGSEALVNLKPGANGLADQLQVELVTGDLVVAGAEETAKVTTLAVKKPGTTSEGAGWLLPLALGGLIGALAASNDDDDDDNNGNVPTPPPPPPAPVPAPEPAPVGPGLLEPTNQLVTGLANSINNATQNAPGLSGLLDTVAMTVNAVTDTVNGLTETSTGTDFSVQDPNSLDPIDGLLGQITSALGQGSALVDPLAGAGTTAAFLGNLQTQIDFVTDGLANLLGDDTRGSSLRDLLGLGLTDSDSPVNGDGLLDPAAVLVDDLTDGLDDNLLEMLQLSGALDVVDSAVNTVADLGNEILDPLLGDKFAVGNANPFDPLDTLVDTLTDGLGEPLNALLTPLAGNGTTLAVVESLDKQVDYVTDGVNTLLGGLAGGLGEGGSPLDALPLGGLTSLTSLLPLPGGDQANGSPLSALTNLLGGLGGLGG